MDIYEVGDTKIDLKPVQGYPPVWMACIALGLLQRQVMLKLKTLGTFSGVLQSDLYVPVVPIKGIWH